MLAIGKACKGTFVSRAFISLHGWSLEILLTVPLMPVSLFLISYFYFKSIETYVVTITLQRTI